MRIHVNETWLNTAALESLSIGETGPESISLQLLKKWFSGQQEFTFHSSGSTGDPKPVTFHRSQLEASAHLSIDALGLRPRMKSLACLDARHVAGAMMLIRSAVAGMDIVIRRPSANPLLDLNESIDFAALVPLQLQAALHECPAKLEPISIVIIGGAPLSESVVPALATFATQFYTTYGMTETLTHIALRKLNGTAARKNFSLLPGISAVQDERGCIVVSAPHLDGPIRTNDVVQFEEDGSFRILGRYDAVINSGGVKIQPGRIEPVVERVLMQLDVSRRSFVAGLPDERLSESVVLVLEGSPLPPRMEEDLKEMLLSRLDRYQMPRRILYADHFMETPSQKIDKKGTLRSLGEKTP